MLLWSRRCGSTRRTREAIRPILHRFETLYFYNTQYEGGVCDRNIFCTGSTPAQNVNKLVPYITKKWGKKVYIVAADLAAARRFHDLVMS